MAASGENDETGLFLAGDCLFMPLLGCVFA